MADQEGVSPVQETPVEHIDEQLAEGEAVQEAQQPAQGAATPVGELQTEKPTAGKQKENKRSMI